MVLPGFVVLLMPLVLFDMYWGHELWGDFAPAWPGGVYDFAGTVGALVPLVFLAWVAPLTRMNGKKSKPPSLAWAITSLPGPAAGYLVAGAIGTTVRPRRRRDWGSDCYSEGGPCWVHAHCPAVGSRPGRHPRSDHASHRPVRPARPQVVCYRTFDIRA